MVRVWWNANIFYGIAGLPKMTRIWYRQVSVTVWMLSPLRLQVVVEFV